MHKLLIKKLICLSILLLFLFTSGCGQTKQNKISSPLNLVTDGIDGNTQKDSLVTPAISVKPTFIETSPQPSPTPDILAQTQKPSNPSAEKLDFSILDKLDNTKYGWGVGANKEHKTPSILDSQKALLKKYDGIYVGDTSKKVIYLTFDEGYENGYTGQILDTLKANDIKAIFFVTGSYIIDQPELVKRMLDEGHVVGNHTVNHLSLPTISITALEKEILELDEQFTQLFGERFKYLRPPQGDYSEKTLAAAQQLGYKTIFWSLTYLDYDIKNQKGAEYAYNIVMDNLHNGAVLLLHAVSKDNAEALDRIIKSIKTQGYIISPFDF